MGRQPACPAAHQMVYEYERQTKGDEGLGTRLGLWSIWVRLSAIFVYDIQMRLERRQQKLRFEEQRFFTPLPGTITYFYS
jgi:hypothetical protein